MKLEEGMYVRTEFGIGSYIKDYTNSQGLTWRVLEGCYNPDNQEDFATLFCDCEIIKASHNIIDLIEVGDYVNGYKVSNKGNDYILGRFVQCDYPVQAGTTNHYRFYEEDIKLIVTKEQFERMSYKVGE